MNLKKVIWPLLTGATLALGGSLIYRREKERRKKLRRSRKFMQEIVGESVARLSAISSGKAAVAEVYFFIWVVQRVCCRHKIKCPDFEFKAREGMLYSSKLTLILRRMIRSGTLRVEDHYLAVNPGAELPRLDEKDRALGGIIDETAAQWHLDFPEDPLVRFGKLFR